MSKRPLAVTLIGWLFIVAGTVGIVYHLNDLASAPVFESVLIELIRVAAIIGGIWLLRGANWARWLIIIWTAYHVIISAMHSVPEIVVHALLLVIVLFFLMRPGTNAYFRRDGSP